MSTCSLLIILSFSCSTSRKVTYSDRYERHDNTSVSNHYEQLYFGIVDSLRRIKAPVENSKSYGLQYSHLSTSLAWSTAEIDSAGRLLHEIANNDSIDAPTRYQWRDRIVFDSIYINVSDTIYVDKELYIEKDLTGWQKTQINLGRLFLLVCLLIVVYRVLKWRLKF